MDSFKAFLRSQYDKEGKLKDKKEEKPRDVVLPIPSHLARKPGESSRAWVNRIKEMAQTDESARAEWFIIRGLTPNREGITHLNVDGSVKEGYELTDEEKGANQAEKEKLGE